MKQHEWWAVGISIQFDGTWFWSIIKDDFIPYLFEVGMHEEFRETKTVGTEPGSWELMYKKLRRIWLHIKPKMLKKESF